MYIQKYSKGTHKDVHIIGEEHTHLKQISFNLLPSFGCQCICFTSFPSVVFHLVLAR